MELLTKYSKKCLNHIEKIKIPKSIIDISNIRKKIQISYENISYKIIKQINIPKIHDLSEPPIFYKFLKILFYSKNLKTKIPIDEKYLTKKLFFEWYRTFSLLDSFDNFYKLILKLPEYIKFIDTLSLYQKKVIDFLSNNKFMSLDIQQHMETSNITYYEVEIKSSKLILFVPDSLKINIEVFLKKISHIIEFYKTFCDFNILIEIFLGKQRKEITFDNFLSSDNVNSGMTQENTYIKIWRYEEVFKVLFHEIIHYLNLIPHNDADNYSKLQKFYKDTFNYEGIDEHYEALTEATAIIYHSVFIEFYTYIPFDEIISNELKFTIFQISKILNFYHMKPSDLFDKSKNSIFQTTNVLSYYIVKGFIVFNGGWFGCNILDYVKFLKKAIITDFLNYVIIDIKKNTNFIYKTLRMSCYELNN